MTIKQLAALLGLSHSTVSRALHDHPAISQATKTLVQDAAKKHGYIPNSAARTLRNASSGAFGVVIPDIKNDFFITVTNALAHEAAERSWQMILAITGDRPDREYKALLSLMTARVDGIIIAPTANPTADTQDLITRTHTVQLLRKHPSLHTPSIAIDDRLGTSLAVQHLQQLGHQRIGYIGSSQALSTGSERLQGYLQNFSQQEQLHLSDITFAGPPQAEFGVEAFHRIMDSASPPSALVLGSPRYAMGILLAARARNLRIPEDLSLVAYGDVPWSSLLDVKLTTVILPEKAISDACVDTIRVFMGEESPQTPDDFMALTESQLLSPWLDVGTSTAAFRAK